MTLTITSGVGAQDFCPQPNENKVINAASLVTFFSVSSWEAAVLAILNFLSFWQSQREGQDAQAECPGKVC